MRDCALARTDLVQHVLSVAGNKPYVLILDDRTSVIFAHTFGLYDVLERGCVCESLARPATPAPLTADERTRRTTHAFTRTVVEQLGSDRQPLRKVDAIYYIHPSRASIDRLLDVSDRQLCVRAWVHACVHAHTVGLCAPHTGPSA